MDAEQFVANQSVRAQANYTTPKERAALRCALGDAAHLCDLIATDIRATNPGRKKGSVELVAQERAKQLDRLGDLFWKFRETIEVPLP